MISNSRFRNALLFFIVGAASGFCGPLGDKFRILVLMTETAKPWVGSDDALTSTIREKLVDLTREAYVNSDATSTYVMPDIELAGVIRVSYTEAGPSLITDLNRLTNPGGHLAEVSYWRNILSADLVMLVVYYPPGNTFGGRAWMKADEDEAFSILNAGRDWEYYTPAHEIGHNFGCPHHTGSLEGGYSYGRGYENLAGGWRDIMATYVEGGYTIRQHWFSNPYMFVGLAARGTTSSNNCTRVHHDRKGNIAGFRDAPSNLSFDSVLQNGEYIHLVAEYTARLEAGGLIWPLGGAYVEAPIVYVLPQFDNEGKLTVDASDDAYVDGAGFGFGSKTKIFASDVASLSNYALLGQMKAEANEIWVGNVNHYGGSEGIFMTPGAFRAPANINVYAGKIWIQAQDVLVHPLYPGHQAALKLADNSEAQIAASGKVSFGSGTSFVNSKVRIGIGSGSTISGYPLFKPGDLNGKVEAKETLAASSLFRSKVRQENGKVMLEYTLPGISSVDVGLYLANGKLVQKRKLGTRDKGTHLEAFVGIPSGAIYLLNIKAGVHTATHRIVR